ncbi:hypothetical protein BD560DRAFT_398579 [Blakeslea trispora]|nr:hypothetical protein BD560DRAFT_398579 [Blakeslea trispora]
MSAHHNSFMRFFEKCQKKENVPCFEHYIKSNSKYIARFCDIVTKDECCRWYNMFSRSAAEFGVEVEKGKAEEAWERMAVAHEVTSGSTVLSFKERLIICSDHGANSVELNQWLVEGEDVRRIFGAKRSQTVGLVRQGKPIKEKEYLLLSCVVDVPCTRGSFVLEVKDKTFKRLRANAGKLPLVKLGTVVAPFKGVLFKGILYLRVFSI